MGDQEFSGEQVEMAVADEPMEDAAMVDVAKKASPDHNGGESNGTAEATDANHEEVPPPQEPAPTTEEDRLWSVVKANSADFNAWTLLIQETEKLDNIAKIRKVYDAFLGEFPLCYGYWKKYADHEARLGSPEKITEVYERAVRAVTYSVDIWMHYCSYAMEKNEDPEEIRRLFERGITYVGTDYLSHLLWDKYIDFEYSQQEWSKLAAIYTRILQIPLHQLDRYYNSFKQIASSRPISELRSAEEAAEAAIAASNVSTAATEDGSEAPPGDTDAAKVEKSNEAEDLERFIGIREALYKKAKEWDAKIRDFETAIRRPYFHVKPLDDMQLGNWHRYLDFIEKEGDSEKVVKLYERCLIACANYPEYWIRYVQRMEEEGNMEAATEALTRSTETFVKRRPEIHLFAARFKEYQGDVKGARAEYELLSTELAPGLLEAVIKHANFEQRQGNSDSAISVFTTAIEAEKAKEESRALPLLYIQYARFVDQISGRTDQAREIYTGALEHLATSKTLWEAVMHFESIHAGEKRVPRLDSLVERATAPVRPDGSAGLSVGDREELSNIYLELVDLFGDVATVKKAEQRHKTLFPPRKSSSESKKRPSPESGNVTERAKVHKPYAGSHAVASPAPVPPAYANGQAQWGGGYGPQGYAQQPQGWQPPPQQAPPVAPQQWNPGYGAQQDVQGAYGGYGGYAAYGPPQQAPPPQQPAGYGGYQGYPPQEFPQQPAYTQSTPTYRSPPPPAPPQPLPPTAQPASYYTGYY